MKFLTVQQPKVAERDILDHLQRAYGLPGSLKRLEGERDELMGSECILCGLMQ